jgi:hypothetical protein
VPINLGAGSGAGFTAAGAGSIARGGDLPNVYGDQGLFGSQFSPFLLASVGGQLQAIAPGQVVRLPAGTVLNRSVNAFAITRTSPSVPVPEVPLPSGFEEKLGAREVVASTPSRLAAGTSSSTDILVEGGELIAHKGGLPVNAVRGAFRIGENESPRPTDRIYVAYNYFHDVNQGIRVAGQERLDIHRQTLGVEKTFLNGDASIGLRLPFLQLLGPTNVDRQTVGDLTMILKFALINNPIQDVGASGLLGGEVLSTGLVVTAPTGGSATFSADDPKVHPAVIQPFVGAIMPMGRWYWQTFQSFAFPTDSRDTTFYLGSFQAGYLLYRDTTGTRTVRAITPVAELHINTPLNNRGILRLPIGQADVVSLTTGLSVGLGSRSMLNTGVNVPLTGPKPYAVEAMVHLNFQF